MSAASVFDREPADTREAIIFATFDAIQKHGYAGLSIQRIADESELSKSTFYHHFDGKDDILLSFAAFLLENFETVFQRKSTGDPEQDLKIFLRLVVGESDAVTEDGDLEAMLGTYLEVGTQAIRDEQFREEFTRTGDKWVENLASLIQEGIDQGVFRDVDPEATAAFLLTMTDGATFEKMTRTDEPMPFLIDQILTYVDDHIVATE